MVGTLCFAHPTFPESVMRLKLVAVGMWATRKGCLAL
jgi:hypothetical protein